MRANKVCISKSTSLFNNYSQFLGYVKRVNTQIICDDMSLLDLADFLSALGVSNSVMITKIWP